MLEGFPVDALRSFCDTVKHKQDPVICVVGSTAAKPLLLVGVSASLPKQGIDAVGIIKAITAVIGGSGGGKPELAQAGTKNAQALRQGIEKAPEIIAEYINNKAGNA